MNILCIGNSFSVDATKYLHDIALCDGEKLEIANLYIGGCSFEMHFRNMLSEEDAYELHYNGDATNFNVSLKKALLNRPWDYVILQQVSHLSADYSTYQPYLSRLAEYIKNLCPKAEIIVHETWAYEEASERLHEFGFEKSSDMYAALHDAYARAANDINARIIPSGTLFEALSDAGVAPLHRDTYHVTLGAGRYALALLWYRFFTGKSVFSNSFSAFEEPISQEFSEIIRKTVDNMNI